MQIKVQIKNNSHFLQNLPKIDIRFLRRTLYAPI